MIDDARRFMVPRMVPDPHQREQLRMWQELLRCTPADVAAAPTKDSARGRLLGYTSPVFGKQLTSREVAELSAQADAPAS